MLESEGRPLKWLVSIRFRARKNMVHFLRASNRIVSGNSEHMSLCALHRASGTFGISIVKDCPKFKRPTLDMMCLNRDVLVAPKHKSFSGTHLTPSMHQHSPSLAPPISELLHSSGSPQQLLSLA